MMGSFGPGIKDQATLGLDDNPVFPFHATQYSEIEIACTENAKKRSQQWHVFAPNHCHEVLKSHDAVLIIVALEVAELNLDAINACSVFLSLKSVRVFILIA